MQQVIEKMLTDFERGGMTRRQLALSLAALVAAHKPRRSRKTCAP